MTEDSYGKRCLRSIWNPKGRRRAAEALLILYGKDALNAAIRCAEGAVKDGRVGDRDFWLMVIDLLRDEAARPPDAA